MTPPRPAVPLRRRLGLHLRRAGSPARRPPPPRRHLRHRPLVRQRVPPSCRCRRRRRRRTDPTPASSFFLLPRPRPPPCGCPFDDASVCPPPPARPRARRCRHVAFCADNAGRRPRPPALPGPRPGVRRGRDTDSARGLPAVLGAGGRANNRSCLLPAGTRGDGQGALACGLRARHRRTVRHRGTPWPASRRGFAAPHANAAARDACVPAATPSPRAPPATPARGRQPHPPPPMRRIPGVEAPKGRGAREVQPLVSGLCAASDAQGALRGESST